jgi:hypothetical protein
MNISKMFRKIYKYLFPTYKHYPSQRIGNPSLPVVVTEGTHPRDYWYHFPDGVDVKQGERYWLIMSEEGQEDKMGIQFRSIKNEKIGSVRQKLFLRGENKMITASIFSDMKVKQIPC